MSKNDPNKTDPEDLEPAKDEGIDDLWADDSPAAPDAPREEPRSVPLPPSATPPRSTALPSRAPSRDSGPRSSPRSGSEGNSDEGRESVDEAPGSSRLRTDQRKNIGILGFSASGKTVYLAMLYHATMERRLFPEEWHANWAVDDGFTRKYVSQASRLIRGVDNKGRKIYTDETKTKVRREFPPGTQTITPIQFELYRKWGLGARPLKVNTQDGVGEAIHNAAIFGPNNLPVEHREAWVSTVELCKNSEALLLFVNLVRFEQSELAPDVSFLVDWLIKEGIRPKVVALVAPGLDSWKGIKTREELRDLVAKTFTNAFRSLEKANIATDIFLVSSVGEEFVHGRETTGQNVADLGQSINPDPKIEPAPVGLDTPWEFIFKKTLPWNARVEPVAIFFDLLWMFRRRALNLVTLPLFALLALGWFGVRPYLAGRADYSALDAIGTSPQSIEAVRSASGLHRDLEDNRIWQLAHGSDLGAYSALSPRWDDLLAFDALRAEETSKPSPDYLALVDTFDRFVSRYGPHPAMGEVPILDWRLRRAERMMADETDVAVQIGLVRELHLNFPEAERARVEPLALLAAESLDRHLGQRETVLERLSDLSWRDVSFARDELESARTLKTLTDHEIFLRVPGFSQIRTRLDRLLNLTEFLDKYAEANVRVEQAINRGENWTALENELRAFRTLGTAYRGLQHPLLRGALHRYTELFNRLNPQEIGNALRRLPGAVTDREVPVATFLSALADWSAFLATHANTLAESDRRALTERTQQTLAVLDGKLTRELGELEKTLDEVLAKAASGQGFPLQAAATFLTEAGALQNAFRDSVRAGMPGDYTRRTRVESLAQHATALGQLGEIVTARATNAAELIAVSARLRSFAGERRELPRLATLAHVLSAEFVLRGDATEARERFDAMENPASRPDLLNPEQLGANIGQLNAYLAEPRYVSLHRQAGEYRRQWFERLGQEPARQSILLALGSPALTAESKEAVVQLADLFLRRWPDDANAADIRERASQINPLGNVRLVMEVSRLDFTSPLSGRSRLAVVQTGPGAETELGATEGMVVMAGRTTGLSPSPRQLAFRVGAGANLALVAQLLDSNGRVISEGRYQLNPSDLRAGARILALSDRTVVGLNIAAEN